MPAQLITLVAFRVACMFVGLCVVFLGYALLARSRVHREKGRVRGNGGTSQDVDSVESTEPGVYAGPTGIGLVVFGCLVILTSALGDLAARWRHFDWVAAVVVAVIFVPYVHRAIKATCVRVKRFCRCKNSTSETRAQATAASTSPPGATTATPP